MTKKRIRQMNGALRRRLTNRPAADWYIRRKKVAFIIPCPFSANVNKA